MVHAQPLAPNALRVAAVWGTTVVALRTLARGESFTLGDAPGSDLPIPDGVEMSPMPLKAGQAGWELDAYGSIGGLLTLRGRGEDPVAIARAGAQVPVMPGDHGLIQYGQLAIFFQYTVQPKMPRVLRGPELLMVLAIFCSAILHLGLLGLVRTLMTPPPLAKPLELTSPDEYAARFGLRRAVLTTPPPDALAGQDKAAGKSAGDPAQDKKAQSSSKKARGADGKLGVSDRGGATQLPGDVRPATHYGGLSDVLEGDTGKEIQTTLKSIQSVSAALSGLSSSTVVLGSGPGAGLKGVATSNSGANDGAAFGAGTLDTGFGGAAYPGAPGRGGNARPGAAGAPGAGPPGAAPAEAKVAVAAGQGSSKGGLSQEQVRRVVMAHLGAVRACYESEVQRNPSLKGGVTVQWTIEPAGTVSGASVASTTLGSQRVEGCVVRQVKGWRFPAGDAPTIVGGFPFKFGIGG